jgi:hypothetical protein
MFKIACLVVLVILSEAKNQLEEDPITNRRFTPAESRKEIRLILRFAQNDKNGEGRLLEYISVSPAILGVPFR